MIQERHLARVNTIHNQNTQKNMKRELNFTEFIKIILGKHYTECFPPKIENNFAAKPEFDP